MGVTAIAVVLLKMVMIHMVMTIIIYTELLTNNEFPVPGKSSTDGWVAIIQPSEDGIPALD